MTGQVDLNPAHLSIVEHILAEHVPECEVRAFGSRAAWNARDTSALDLAVIGDGQLPSRTLTMLKEAFEESRLPMCVDVVDWHAITDGFREFIEPDYVVVQEAVGSGSWPVIRLDEAVHVNPPRPLKRGTDAPFVAMGDLLEHSRQLPVLSTREFKGGGSRFCNGDTLLARITPSLENGKTAWVSGLPEGATGHGSTEFIVMSARDNVTDPKFVYYLARSPDFRRYAISQMTGTSGRQRVPSDVVRDFELALPPIEEQRAIARVLGMLDDKIELNQRMSETLEEMARAFFKSWFVDFDPVYAKAEGQPSGLPSDLDALFPASFEASELGEIPVGWEVRSIDEIATFTNGLALQRFPPEGDEWLPVIKIAEMRRGYTERTGRASVNIASRYIVEDGDVLFSWSGSLELVLWTHGRGALNQHLFKVRSDEFPRWFYLGWTYEHLDDFRGIAASKATTMGHIQRHHLTDAKVVVPPQEVIATCNGVFAPFVMQQLGREIEARELALQRDTLLSQLVSGELRVARMGLLG